MKLLFLKQTSICEPLIPIERDIETALSSALTPAQFLSFDFVTGIRNVTPPPGSSHDEIIKEYFHYLVNTIPKEFEYLLLLNGYAVNNFLPGILQELKNRGVKIISWHVDDPYYIDIQEEICPAFHTILTVDKNAVPLWKERVDQVEYLPLAAPSGKKSANEEYRFDLSFIATPFKGSRRVQFIQEQLPFLSNYRTVLAGKSPHDSWVTSLTDHDSYDGEVIDTFLSREDANQIYDWSKINLNLHKDSFGHIWDKNRRQIEAISPNERFFYLAGTGNFQLIDDSRDFSGLNISPELIITFKNTKEFQEKAAYFIKNDREREELTRELQSQAQQFHTYNSRISHLLELL